MLQLLIAFNRFPDESFRLLKHKEKDLRWPESCKRIKSCQFYNDTKQKSSKVEKPEPENVWYLFVDKDD